MPRLPKSVVLNKSGYKIQSPEGLVPFLGVNKIVKESYMHLRFSNGAELKCSEDHPLMTIDGIVTAKDITKKEFIETRDAVGCFVVSKRRIKKRIDLYDIVNSGKRHLYYSNGVVSHNCEFLGSSNTLVSGEKLACIAYIDPIREIEGNMFIYEEPIKFMVNEDSGEVIEKDHLYAITVDVSEGKNMDYHAFQVIDISAMPYRQVAVYRNNSIPPLLLPTILKQWGDYYNNAYILVEINNNPQVADILQDELEYENILRIFTGNKKGQVLSFEGGKGIAPGIKMSALVKRLGCSTLKTLIEHDKLLLRDFETISELTTFIQTGQSFSAEEGCNDDLAMSLIIFAWLATQKVFKEIVEHDLRKQLQFEQYNYSEEDNLPVGEFDNGITTPYFIDDGSIWMETKSHDVYNALMKELLDF